MGFKVVETTRPGAGPALLSEAVISCAPDDEVPGVEEGFLERCLPSFVFDEWLMSGFETWDVNASSCVIHLPGTQKNYLRGSGIREK